MPNKLKSIQFARALREWCKDYLPFYESAVGYDLVIFLALHHLKNETVTVKYLFDTLPHSDTAIRLHYMRLIRDGYIVTVLNPSDKRVKHITATEKFEKIIHEYAKTIYKLSPRNE